MLAVPVPETVAAIKALVLLDPLLDYTDLMWLLKTESYKVRIAVIRALFSLKNGLEMIEKLAGRNHPELTPLAKHVLDRRITA